MASEDQLRLEIENVDLRRLLTQAAMDAAEQRVVERLQRLLVEELHHKVKNTLATVMAITRQKLVNSSSLERAGEAIQYRLMALGTVHDLLLRTNWTSSALSGIIKAAIAPFDTAAGGRFFVQSSKIEVGASGVLPPRDGAERALHQRHQV